MNKQKRGSGRFDSGRNGRRQQVSMLAVHPSLDSDCKRSVGRRGRTTERWCPYSGAGTDSLSHAGDSAVTTLQLRTAPYRGSKLGLVLSGECRQQMGNSQENDCRRLVSDWSHGCLTRQMVSHLLQTGVCTLDSREMTAMKNVGWTQQEYWHSDPMLAHWTRAT